MTLGEPFEGGFASVVVQAAVTAAGEEAVLKVQDSHRESEYEAAALELWDGGGAVRLLAHDPERHALLLERCVPGTPLSSAGRDEALGVFVELLPRLWKPAGPPFRPLAEEAAWWAENLPAEWEANGRSYERRLLDAALAALRDLAPAQGDQVLLHQDLHGGNVLAAQREPWLVIDPKPLAGEREFGLAPIVRSSELGATRLDVLHRLDRLSSELGLNRERASGWALAQTLAWSGGGRHAYHLDVARWLVEAG